MKPNLLLNVGYDSVADLVITSLSQVKYVVREINEIISMIPNDTKSIVGWCVIILIILYKRKNKKE